MAQAFHCPNCNKGIMLFKRMVLIPQSLLSDTGNSVFSWAPGYTCNACGFPAVDADPAEEDVENPCSQDCENCSMCENEDE
jgi:hypothetical protein